MKSEGLSSLLYVTPPTRRYNVEKKGKSRPERKPKYEPGEALAGRTIVITGKCPKTRADVENDFIRQGVMCKPRVTKNVDALVVGINPGRSKLLQAQKYNIPTITYQEARSLAFLGNNIA